MVCFQPGESRGDCTGTLSCMVEELYESHLKHGLGKFGLIEPSAL
jgi:hypothetical protein